MFHVMCKLKRNGKVIRMETCQSHREASARLESMLRANPSSVLWITQEDK